MNPLAAFKAALAALRLNALRSFLAMLGVIIGVASVIVMVSVASGAGQAIEARIKSLGTNLLVIQPGSYTSGGRRAGEGTALGAVGGRPCRDQGAHPRHRRRDRDRQRLGADRRRQHQLDHLDRRRERRFPRGARLGARRGPQLHRGRAQIGSQGGHPRRHHRARAVRRRAGHRPANAGDERALHRGRPAHAKGPVRLRHGPGRHRARAGVDRAPPPVRRREDRAGQSRSASWSRWHRPRR